MSLPRMRRLLTPFVLALALGLGVCGSASAAGDLSTSQFTCTAANALTTRPGDDIVCLLAVRTLDSYVDGVTAAVTVPSTTSFDPAAPGNEEAIPNDPLHATSLFFDTKSLGFMTPYFTKTVGFRLHILETTAPGTVIAPVATISSTDAPTVTLTASLTVIPPPADLRPTTFTCADTGPPPLRPGDTVACTLQLIDQAGTENATAVTVTVNIPSPLTWAAGGNETSHAGSLVSWSPSALPAGVPAGPPSAPPLTFRATLPTTMLGGASIVFNGWTSFKSATSGAAGFLLLASQPLTLAPGPADLTTSAMVCRDVDGAPLYPGDALQCTVTVTDAAGHEDAAGVTAAIDIPPGTTVSAGPLSPDKTQVLFPAADLGTIAAGTSKTGIFVLRIDDTTAPGTVIAPSASVRGQSAGLGTPIALTADAAPVTVAARPVTPQSKPVTAATAPTTPAPAGTKTCASRRVVIVNIRPPRGRHWTSVTIAFSTKTIKAKRVKGKIGYFRARLVFQGLPRGPLTIRITGRTTSRRTVHRTRTYHLCVAKAT